MGDFIVFITPFIIALNGILLIATEVIDWKNKKKRREGAGGEADKRQEEYEEIKEKWRDGLKASKKTVPIRNRFFMPRFIPSGKNQKRQVGQIRIVFPAEIRELKFTGTFTVVSFPISRRCGIFFPRLLPGLPIPRQSNSKYPAEIHSLHQSPVIWHDSDIHSVVEASGILLGIPVSTGTAS